VRLDIVIYSNDPETVWNAFRYGNYAIKDGDKYRRFLRGESESLDIGTSKSQMRCVRL
jgi:uncharacterized protein involved in oxidation of intracellular sulfur